MSQLNLELSLRSLFKILRLSADVAQKRNIAFISAQLARYSKTASPELLNMMANYENIKEISQRDLEDFLRSIMASNAGDNAIGAAAATLKQEEGFPMFPKLPKELRIEIWKKALPGPRTINTTRRPEFISRFNATSGSSHNCLLTLRSVCRESIDVVSKRYEAIPFSNFALATTYFPHLAPANGFILVDNKQDAVHFEAQAIRHCINQWNGREETRKIFSLTKHLPEAGFSLTSLSLPAAIVIYSQTPFGAEGIEWLAQFKFLQMITWVEDGKEHHPVVDTMLQIFGFLGGSDVFNKQGFLVYRWNNTLNMNPGLKGLEGVKLEFVGFDKSKEQLHLCI
ncbi:hypothetical protein DL95DRAFT_485448 [Leptodontidium sp. 2 PMI_412]|nr:hypothetical protein DL95DRAFT_485448 [Leptodontidium sp. 2 PMI_412]